MPSSALAPSARRVLLVGGSLAFALMVLAALDVGGQAGTWDFSQAIVATFTGLIVTVLGLHAAADADRVLRRVSAAPVLLLVPVGTVLYFVLGFIGWRSTPSPLDIVFLLLALPTLVLVREGARAGGTNVGLGVVAVDYSLALFAAVALVIGVFGERTVPAGTWALAPLVYPLYFHLARSRFTPRVDPPTLRARPSGSGITITERHEPMPPVELDSAAIEQVVVHIIANARNAMPDGGTLAVEARAEAGEAVIAIRDSGIGMDEATRAHAFDPFFTTRDPSLGAGLGLSVTQRLVADHGGSVTLESSPNHGTLVQVRLPLVASRVDDGRVAV